MTIKQLKQKLPTIKEIIGWKEFPEEKDKLLIDIIANMYKDAINQAKAKQAFQKFLMWTNAQ